MCKSLSHKLIINSESILYNKLGWELYLAEKKSIKWKSLLNRLGRIIDNKVLDYKEANLHFRFHLLQVNQIYVHLKVCINDLYAFHQISKLMHRLQSSFEIRVNFSSALPPNFSYFQYRNVHTFAKYHVRWKQSFFLVKILLLAFESWVQYT